MIDFKRVTVLLIDDEPFIRLTMRQIFAQAGIPPQNITDISNVADGMTEVARVRPSVVFCDIHMPGETGIDFVTQLRAVNLPDLAATPVVMLTSDATADSVMLAKEAHVHGYLVKPVSINSVKQAIERALKGGAA